VHFQSCCDRLKCSNHFGTRCILWSALAIVIFLHKMNWYCKIVSVDSFASSPHTIEWISVTCGPVDRSWAPPGKYNLCTNWSSVTPVTWCSYCSYLLFRKKKCNRTKNLIH
jgi:hypothetical protein